MRNELDLVQRDRESQLNIIKQEYEKFQVKNTIGYVDVSKNNFISLFIYITSIRFSRK